MENIKRPRPVRTSNQQQQPAAAAPVASKTRARIIARALGVQLQATRGYKFSRSSTMSAVKSHPSDDGPDVIGTLQLHDAALSSCAATPRATGHSGGTGSPGATPRSLQSAHL